MLLHLQGAHSSELTLCRQTDSPWVQLLCWSLQHRPALGWLHLPHLEPRSRVLQARAGIPPLGSNKMKMSLTKGEAASFIRKVVIKLETSSCGEQCNMCLEFFSSIQTQGHPHTSYLWQVYHHSESPHFQFISVFQRNLFGK